MSGPSWTSASVWEPTVLNELGDQLGDADGSVVATIVAAYLAEGRELVDRLQSRADNGLPLHEAAHALRGSTLTVGGMRLAYICEQIERGADVADPRGAAKAVGREFSALADQLAGRFRHGASSATSGTLP